VDRLILLLATMFVAAMLSFAPWVRGGQLPSEPSQTVATLESGKAIERAMAGGEAHDYKVFLKAGRFLHVVLDLVRRLP
jgi:hypothetical protein